MKEEKFLSRLENLKFQGEKTGYRYMGSIESCYHLIAFTKKNDDGHKIIDNILCKDNEEYVPIEEICNNCESKDECDVKDKIFDISSDYCDEFGWVSRDIIQKVVYYDEKLNSAVVFVVNADYVVYNYGFENIVDLIDDIYTGVNSPYNYMNENLDYTFKADKNLKEALLFKNSFITSQLIITKIISLT